MSELQREVEELERKSASSRLFDIRLLIGGLFALYGVIVGIVGLTDGQAEIDKAQGININLWTGVGMLVLGVVFLLWAKLNPQKVPAAEASEQDGTSTE
ncbi:hypothetical protein BIV57_03855 [Mangrovactinospora gilvigrisea]|uniref:Uncharacterized protein n=1 Tax=Mangrovactinospora gilvigrisea TaxID=1428644 RepID=A0A1J7BJR0_9ACTN|nr:hypothetical protein [Mangrovactinospora gilvigrisea]OIV38878.1 hypothetical protein BIV57_03855 [Mangrovactinospora gilvigrisea]